MLKPAQLYKEELTKKVVSEWYTERYYYYSCGITARTPEIANSNYDACQFVSVDKDDNVIGYFVYELNYNTRAANNIAIMSFDPGNMIFMSDIYHAIIDFFEKWNYNKMTWWCLTDNRYYELYIKFIQRHGGRLVGIFRDDCVTADFKLHDTAMFEILKREFHR